MCHRIYIDCIFLKKKKSLVGQLAVIFTGHLYSKLINCNPHFRDKKLVSLKMLLEKWVHACAFWISEVNCKVG